MADLSKTMYNTNINLKGVVQRMNEIIPSFKQSLFDSDIKDTTIDLLECGIDSVITDGLLQEIPIVKTIVAIGKFAQNIADRNLMKQTIAFINEFNQSNISEERLYKYRQSLENDPKKAEAELGRVIVILNRIIDDNKAKILAQFYAAYVKGDISWSCFRELSEVIDRLFINDILLLSKLYTASETVLYGDGGYVADRLIAIGLINNPQSEIKSGDYIKPISKLPLNLSDLGKTFCQLYREEMMVR